ncbi:MAG TPA: EamA family transporter, partial [Ilumatobacteraceae bacterium]|nr:EamA family transporter [Ilumatobacteraceae bacterium]
MTATATPRTTTHIPIAASLMALGAGVVWSFGAVTARMAKHADPFQYLIWRSVGVLVVMELVAAFRRRPMLLPKAYTSGKWMLWADFGLLLASFMFVYAVKTTTAANASFLGSVTPLAAVVMELVAVVRRQPMLLPKAYTSGKWMLWADFGLLLASFMFVYAVKTTTAANASFLGSV